MPETEAFDVEFRYGAVETSEGEMGIIVLGYTDREACEQAFANIHSYITAGAETLRLFDIRFERDSCSTYQLIIRVGVNDVLREIKISGVADEYVVRLGSSLSNVPYFLITAGYYIGGQFQLLPVNQYNLFRAQIEIDGETVTGVSKPGFDPHAVLDRMA